MWFESEYCGTENAKMVCTLKRLDNKRLITRVYEVSIGGSRREEAMKDGKIVEKRNVEWIRAKEHTNDPRT